MTTSRHLGTTSSTAIVIASMVGAGVFTTSGFSLADLGNREIVLLAWAVGGVVAVLGAVCYGALAVRLSESGGEYHFLSVTIHPFAGFLAGWVSLLVGFTAPIALAAAALQAYARVWWPEDLPLDLLGTAAILFAGAVHGLRVSGGTWIQNLVVLAKLALIGGLVVFGLPHLPPHEATEAVPFSLPAFSVSLVWISLSYSGWNAAVYVAGEVHRPERNLPLALVGGTVLVTVIYLLLNTVFVYAAPIEALAGQEDVAAVAARAIGGDAMERLTRAVVALALLSSILVNVMTGPRVYIRMAQDGLMPRLLVPRGRAPTVATALQIALAIGVLWISTLQELLGYVGYVLSMSTAVTVMGLIRLRRREGAERVPIPGYPYVPVVFIVATLGAALFMMLGRWQEPVLGLATLALGALVYLFFRRSPPPA